MALIAGSPTGTAGDPCSGRRRTAYAHAGSDSPIRPRAARLVVIVEASLCRLSPAYFTRMRTTPIAERLGETLIRTTLPGLHFACPLRDRGQKFCEGSFLATGGNYSTSTPVPNNAGIYHFLGNDQQTSSLIAAVRRSTRTARSETCRTKCR